ncbi:unnamed protein product [Echinostoma caproni]|uniref:Golgi apparatus protein 1 n=1 Tax=Echinostoma caproni TaxID=27848 RepID=A0A183AW95_9TREM|nr:unnamed protein product [Echinostoma caproni]
MRSACFLVFFASVVIDLANLSGDENANISLHSCSRDMELYRCRSSDFAKEGKNLSVNDSLALTIHCLRSHLKKLELACRDTLLHIVEQQSKDYHLDPILYKACREDQQRLCPNVQSGGGRVYECLRTHKYHDQMSVECRKEIFERQILIASDYRINFRFAESCAVDIANAKCISENKSGANLAHLMLCLEAVEKPRLTDDNKLIPPRHLLPTCKAELTELRRELLEDYRLSPDLMLHCNSTIERYCSKRKRRPRTMIHCLVKVINKPVLPADRPPEMCINAVHDLLKLLVRKPPESRAVCYRARPQVADRGTAVNSRLTVNKMGFGPPNKRSQMISGSNRGCDQPSEAEIQTLGRHKAPGSDGLSPALFKDGGIKLV